MVPLLKVGTYLLCFCLCLYVVARFLFLDGYILVSFLCVCVFMCCDPYPTVFFSFLLWRRDGVSSDSRNIRDIFFAATYAEWAVDDCALHVDNIDQRVGSSPCSNYQWYVHLERPWCRHITWPLVKRCCNWFHKCINPHLWLMSYPNITFKSIGIGRTIRPQAEEDNECHPEGKHCCCSRQNGHDFDTVYI